jgi:hypothetical protein
MAVLSVFWQKKAFCWSLGINRFCKIKNPTHQEKPISNPLNKIYSKGNSILLVIEYRRNFEIFLSKFIENY